MAPISRGGKSGWKRWVAAAAASALILAPALRARASEGPPALIPAGMCSTPAGTWPEYQGGPTHAANACSSLNRSNVAALAPAWFVASKGPVTGTPAVAFGSVFAGDHSGFVYRIDAGTGRVVWTFDAVGRQACFLDVPDPHADTHRVGFGEIPGSPATAVIDGIPTVFVAAGGSLFALDGTTGTCLWAQDTDPGAPGNAVEIESSPVVDTAVTPPEVLVGNDDNSSSGVAVTGLMAFDATSGHLLWKYLPERDVTLTPATFDGSDAMTLSCGDGSPDPDCNPAHVPGLAPDSLSYADACGDVWSSPALDATFADPGGTNSFEGSAATPPAGWIPKVVTRDGAANPAAGQDGLVVFGTGNCAAEPDPAAALGHGDYVDNQAIFALDPVTGVRVWNMVEPYGLYDSDPAEPGGGDDDFGSSPIIAPLPVASVPVAQCPADPADPGSTTLVIEGSKSGTAYGVCESNGHVVWSVQAAQPGEASNDLVGAVGGFIGSPSLGTANGRPTAFFSSALPTPLSNDGVREPGDGDSNLSSCPGLAPLPVLPACPDLSLLDNPQRLASLHAVDAATGRVVYQAPSLPTYAPSTYTGGMVLLPDSLAGAVTALDADSGRPLWTFPLGAIPASAAAVLGHGIVFGTGESNGSLGTEPVPPQLTGVWLLTTTAKRLNPIGGIK